MSMEIRINEIQIKKRARHNLGSLTDLANSMKKHGLMNPVILTENKILISGHRRLEAARSLGWKTIEARILSDLNDIERMEMEIDENLHRKDFTPDEIVEAFHNLDKLKNPSPLRLLCNSIKSFFAHFLKKSR